MQNPKHFVILELDQPCPPVFYVNFVNKTNMQFVYQNFISISKFFIETIQNDLKTLNNSCDAHDLMSSSFIDCILPNSSEKFEIP